jgi:hypothetical protein
MLGYCYLTDNIFVLNIGFVLDEPGPENLRCAARPGQHQQREYCKTFFKKGPAKTASILKVTLKIVTLFAELLDMFNHPNQKP